MDNIELVKLLLEYGADVNSKDDDGYTPLSIACKYKNTELVKLLIEHGADIDMVDTDKLSPEMKTLIDKLKGSQQKIESRVIRRLYRR
jgi:ankyrin repeat protein